MIQTTNEKDAEVSKEKNKFERNLIDFIWIFVDIAFSSVEK